MGGIKKESFRNQKWRILEKKKPPKVEDWKSILNEILTFEKKTTKSGGFSSFDKKSNKKKKKKNSQSGGFSSFRNQKWRILRKKAPKVEDFVQNRLPILHFWCFFFLQNPPLLVTKTFFFDPSERNKVQEHFKITTQLIFLMPPTSPASFVQIGAL